MAHRQDNIADANFDPEHAWAVEERRVEQTEGLIRNPATGKMVKADGRVGRQVLAAHRAQLAAQGSALPTGVLGRRAGIAAQPGPIIINYAKLGRIRPTGAFKLQAYVSQGAAPTTTAEFAKNIAKTLQGIPNVRHTNVSFQDADGYRVIRAIHGKTARDILHELNHLQYEGDLNGSDGVGVGYTLSTAGFDVGSVTLPAGGAYKFQGISKGKGRAHPHFKLTEFATKAQPGDCLFAVLRAVAKAAGKTLPAARNSSIRLELGIPEGNIPADPAFIDALARKFGLYVRVITGMTVPADTEREYDDNPARLFDRNLCRTVATPLIIAAGGEPDAPACDVYLAGGHYEYISRVLEPVLTCRITGDLISADDKRTSAEIAQRVISQGRRWYAEHQPPVAASHRHNYKERIIVYDYETFYTDDGTVEPYALGYTIFDPKDPALANAAFAGLEGSVTQIVRLAGESHFSVTAPLLDEILRAPEDVRYTLVSFNGARFDHFLLAQAANNRGALTSVFATGAGGLRSLTISGRHTTLDLAKLVPAMSLASACDGFQTSPTKLEGFSHVVVQREYEAGRLYTWLHSNANKLSEYLARDVLSEASLFIKLSQTLTQMTESPIYGSNAVQTIGGHSWAVMNKKCALPKRVSTRQLDETIRSAVVGGRVQAYTSEKVVTAEQLHMVDFASLYPTAMAAVTKAAACFAPEEKWGFYPTGAANSEPVRTPDWQEGDVGIYEVIIHDQPPNLPNVLPRRSAGEPLDWSYRGEFTTLATHIDLSLIRRGGGHFTVLWGLKWPVCQQGLFQDFIIPLAKLKDEQDEFKKLDETSRANKGPGCSDYNPALRMVIKLLMNAGSGKCCQANYDDLAVMATGGANQLAAEAKMDPNRPRTWIPIGGETCIIVGKKPDDKIYGKRAKPSILAVLIYAYSRALVWRTLCQHNCLYSDTDSGLFRTADYEALRAHFPELDPAAHGGHKELGDLEQELKAHSRAEAFLLGAKDYAVFLYGPNDEILGTLEKEKSKLRTKGVNLRRDRLLLSTTSTKEIEGLSMSEFTEEYNTISEERSQPLSNMKIAREFYARRAAGEQVHVLASQIVRSFKDPDAAPLSLTQRYLIKELGGASVTPSVAPSEPDNSWDEFITEFGL